MITFIKSIIEGQISIKPMVHQPVNCGSGGRANSSLLLPHALQPNEMRRNNVNGCDEAGIKKKIPTVAICSTPLRRNPFII
jgi:hypothetical protein